MKYLPLIWAGLWRKPLRTTLTTLALVVAFVLFGLMQGINAGFSAIRDSARDDGLSVNSRYNVPMPLAYKAEIAQMPGVKSVIAIEYLGGPVNGDLKKQVGIGFADEGFFEYYRWIDVTPAQLAEFHANRTGIIMGEMTADRLGLKAGDRFTIKSLPNKNGSDWTLDIVAVVKRKDVGGLATVTSGNFEYLNEERTVGKDMINQYLVLVNDPNQAAAIGRAIDDRFINSPAPTRTTVDKENAEQQYQDDSVHTMASYIIVATLFALLLMTSNSMMQSFRERIPELGTLKALGFDDRQVLVFVMAEALVQCLLGAAIGLAIAQVSAPHVKKLVSGPAVLMNVSWSLMVLGLLVACAVAFISAAIPAWRAGRMQVVQALTAR